MYPGGYGPGGGGEPVIESLPVLWLTTIAFAATAGWFLIRCVRPGALAGSASVRVPTLTDRVSCFAHAMMGAAMIAMVWGGGVGVPVVPQIAAFALAVTWFLVLAAVPRLAPPRSAPGSGRLSQVHHSLVMGAMVWMVVVMAGSMPAAGQEHSHAMHGAASSAPAAATPAAVGFSPALVVLGLVMAGYLALAALPWLSETVRFVRHLLPVAAVAAPAGPRPASRRAAARTARGHALDAASHATMSLAMGAAVVAIL